MLYMGESSGGRLSKRFPLDVLGLSSGEDGVDRRVGDTREVASPRDLCFILLSLI